MRWVCLNCWHYFKERKSGGLHQCGACNCRSTIHMDNLVEFMTDVSKAHDEYPVSKLTYFDVLKLIKKVKLPQVFINMRADRAFQLIGDIIIMSESWPKDSIDAESYLIAELYRREKLHDGR